jgi:hypothetical protein
MLVVLSIRHEDSLFSKINKFASLTNVEARKNGKTKQHTPSTRATTTLEPNHSWILRHMLVVLNIRHEDSLFSKINKFASLDSGRVVNWRRDEWLAGFLSSSDGRKSTNPTRETLLCLPESVSCNWFTSALATPRIARGREDSSCRALSSSPSSVPVDIFLTRARLPPLKRAGGRVAI